MTIEIEFFVLQTVYLVKPLDRMRMRIETGETAVRAQPQPVVAIGFDAVDDLARDAAKTGLILEAHGARLCGAADHTIQAAAGGTDPQLAVVIQMQRIY